MATEQPKVSGQAGEAELPTPQFSESDASSTSTDVEAIVNKVVERLAPTLEQTVERKAKSLQDKRFSKIEKELGLRSTVLAELEEQGVTVPQDVRTQMQIRELQEQITRQPSQPAQVRDDGSSPQKAAAVEAIAELKKYELDPNDPGFIEVLRGKYQSRDAFDKAVLGHVVGKLAPQKPANPADVVQSPVTTSVTKDDAQAKITRLAELQKQPTRYKAEIAQLTKELDATGWK